MGLTDREKIILANEDFYCKSLNIGISVDEMMAEFNAFDWLFMGKDTYSSFQKRLKFENPAGVYQSIREKAFLFIYNLSITNINELIEEVHSAYRFGNSSGAKNEHLAKYYYIKYWADKKCIAVNYNEMRFEERQKFNLYTILMDIFAVNLENFNSFNNAQKNR